MPMVLSLWGNCRDPVCLCIGDGQTGTQSFHVLDFLSFLSMFCLFNSSESKPKHPTDACLEIFYPIKKKKKIEDKIDSKELLKKRSYIRTPVCEHLVSLG